jgi:hypothetical protein
MKTKFFILLVITFYSLSSCSQANKIVPANKRAHCVFGELGGNGIIISANYDVRFEKKQNGFGARAGLGYVTDLLDRGGGLSIPIGVN